MYEFQDDDVNYLKDKPNVLVASEMGTGKTYVAIKLDKKRREKTGGKTLVVAPKSVLSSWVDHFTDLTNLSVYSVDAKNRKGSFDKFLANDGDVFVVHWDAVRLMPELRDIRWLHIIGDEIHRIQNRKAQQTEAFKRLITLYKTGLSGTPVTAAPDKYWSVLHWLYPKDYSSYWRYRNYFIEQEDVWEKGPDGIPRKAGYKKIVGVQHEKELIERVRPFFVRHLKKEQCCPQHPNGVLPQLPDKYYTEIKVDLTPQQRRVYDEMRRTMVAWVHDEEGKEQPVIAPIAIAKLTRLIQFSCAYGRYAANDSYVLSEPSSKLDALMELIIDNDHQQIVVFSQFAQLIELLKARLHKAKIRHVILTGSTSQDGRGQAVKAFQDGNVQVFAGTIGAGGTGVTLTAASTIAFTDRLWSPASNLQAEDRGHRIGQQKALQVIDFVGRDTVDGGRNQQIQTTWASIKKMLGDT